MNGPTAITLICVISLIMAQGVKFIGYSIYSKCIRFDMITSTGGMPSSHSCLVTSLLISICLFVMDSGDMKNAFYIPIALVLCIVVVHDSMGVRYEASKHAQVLNKMMKDLGEVKKKELGYEKELKEFLGHRPIEAFSGVVLGIIIGIVGFFVFKQFM